MFFEFGFGVIFHAMKTGAFARHAEMYGDEQMWKTVKLVLEEAWKTEVASMAVFSRLTARRIAERLAQRGDWERASRGCVVWDQYV